MMLVETMEPLAPSFSVPAPVLVSVPPPLIRPPSVNVCPLPTPMAPAALRFTALASVALTLFDNVPPFSVTGPAPKAVLLSASRTPLLIVVPPV